MRALVFRLNELEKHQSWRPRSLTDMRGPRFPDEYHEHRLLDAKNIVSVLDQYDSELGDVILLGKGDDLEAFVVAPFGWENVKFGNEWKSPS